MRSSETESRFLRLRPRGDIVSEAEKWPEPQGGNA